LAKITYGSASQAKFNDSIVSQSNLLTTKNIQAVNERITDLEATNLNLKRMLQLIAADPTRDNRKLLGYRETLKNAVGLPV
jgi:hypothetical protein